MSTYRKTKNYEALREVLCAGGRVTFEVLVKGDLGSVHFGVGSMSLSGSFVAINCYLALPDINDETRFAKWCKAHHLEWYEYTDQ